MDHVSPREARGLDTVESLSRSIADRGWTAPAILALELLKPLGFLGSQAWLLAEPLFGRRDREILSRYATLLEDRSNIERLIRALEDGRHTHA